ncbi:MAG: hypothetical protein SGJ13_14190 [Actinomycetota bacterium]|nr:hypothetical protein [Actinomycetota bacterium]
MWDEPLQVDLDGLQALADALARCGDGIGSGGACRGSDLPVPGRFVNEMVASINRAVVALTQAMQREGHVVANTLRTVVDDIHGADTWSGP